MTKKTQFTIIFILLGFYKAFAQYDDLYSGFDDQPLVIKKEVIKKQNIILPDKQRAEDPEIDEKDRYISKDDYMSYEDYFNRLNREELFDYYSDGYRDGLRDAQRNTWRFSSWNNFYDFSPYYRRPIFDPRRRNNFYFGWNSFSGWNYGFQSSFGYPLINPYWSANYGLIGGPRFAYYNYYDPWYFRNNMFWNNRRAYQNRSWNDYNYPRQSVNRSQTIRKQRYVLSSTVPSRYSNRTLNATSSSRKEAFTPENGSGRSDQTSKTIKGVNPNLRTNSRNTSRTIYSAPSRSYNNSSRNNSSSRSYSPKSNRSYNSAPSRSYNNSSRNNSSSRSYSPKSDRSYNSAPSRSYNNPSRNSSPSRSSGGRSKSASRK